MIRATNGRNRKNGVEYEDKTQEMEYKADELDTVIEELKELM